MSDLHKNILSLQVILNQKKEEFATTASQKKKQIYKEGIEAVRDSGLLTTAKQVGDLAPDFELKNTLGESVTLADYLKKGSVILTWYRGGWCPYCNLTLQRLQLELPNFKARGANLIALTPELPDRSLSTSEKQALAFEVLSDIDNQVAKNYGIVFELIPEVATSYQQAFDMHSYNGNSSNELPLTASYVINQEGKIIYAFLDADYRNRAEPSTILAALED